MKPKQEGKEDSGLHQLWDKLVKVIGDRYQENFLQFIYPMGKLEVCGKVGEETIVVEYQVSDINFKVLDSGKEKILNIEAYSEWDDKIPVEVFTKNAIITRSLKHKLEVISVVLLLDDKVRIGKYESTLGTLTNSYQFPIVTLANAQEILEKYPPLAPFLLKVNLAKYKNQVLSIVKDDVLLKSITASILNKLGIPKQEALQMTNLKNEELRQAFIEVPLLHDLVDDIKEEGIVEGKEEKARDIAKNMLAEGYAVAAIAKVTGLTADEIRQLKA